MRLCIRCLREHDVNRSAVVSWEKWRFFKRSVCSCLHQLYTRLPVAWATVNSCPHQPYVKTELVPFWCLTTLPSWPNLRESTRMLPKTPAGPSAPTTRM
ncbi:hypothetical protein L596_003683 [Steinernema carpocapsae]|uniref:Uncharacterized protein n=1 Tax=Steinernema carpocapsae TaxID=34508 RepID=A0A4U8UTG5_STECR|nr:hypothetical protein L596_003683 [Steinernema carpocapsae]